MRFTKAKIGRQVRITGVPALTGMSAATKGESKAVFEFLVGKKKRISGIDERGHAELMFRIRKGPLKGLHWVSLEPEFLTELK
mgnify:CR=1 FL=1